MYQVPERSLPKNGLYFSYEDGEVNSHDGGPRIVRVGNHPHSQNRLYGRLCNHYYENKNSSVFRKLLGGALMRRQDLNHACLKPAPGKGHWEKQGERTCERCGPFEKEVSALLRERFRFRVVGIDDMEFRNLMERKLIGILSECPKCQPSGDWLGRFAYSEKVRRSGMWNSDYVNETYTIVPEEWPRFMAAVTQTMRDSTG